MGDGPVEKPIVLDEKEDKENAPPPSTAESVRPTEPRRLQRSRLLGHEWKIYPIMYIGICFNNFYCACVSIKLTCFI